MDIQITYILLSDQKVIQICLENVQEENKNHIIPPYGSNTLDCIKIVMYFGLLPHH